MNIHHYYHVYALGNWQQPLNEHIDAVKMSGLLNAIGHIKIGIIGSEPLRNKVYEFLDLRKTPYEIIAEQDNGWEQMTQTKIYDDSHNNEGVVLYAHTKGAANPHQQDMNEVSAWRRTMCYYNIINWRDCVESLKTNDVCGVYWMEMPTQPEHFDHKWFFAGTYWWARMDYIRQIPPPSMKNRYNAEGWIGMSPNNIKVRDFAPGWDDARNNKTYFPPMQEFFIY